MKEPSELPLQAEPAYRGNGSGPSALTPVNPRKSNPIVLIVITLIGLLGGFAAGMTVESIGAINRDVPPWVFATQIGSILLFLGHMGYQILLVFLYPDHEDE